MKIKFICDSMFGKVARWLRLFGYDTLYSNKFEDDEILEIARKENRIILTKDKLLSHRASKEYIRNLYINEKDLALRLALIKKAFNIKTEILPPPKGKSRCPLCNSEIIEVKDKKTIKNRIFPSTYEHFDEFWMCSNEKCQKIYYVGEHWKDFEMTSKKIDEILKVI